jgi:hypothetical protein
MRVNVLSVLALYTTPSVSLIKPRSVRRQWHVLALHQDESLASRAYLHRSEVGKEEVHLAIEFNINEVMAIV